MYKYVYAPPKYHRFLEGVPGEYTNVFATLSGGNCVDDVPRDLFEVFTLKLGKDLKTTPMIHYTAGPGDSWVDIMRYAVMVLNPTGADRVSAFAMDGARGIVSGNLFGGPEVLHAFLGETDRINLSQQGLYVAEINFGTKDAPKPIDVTQGQAVGYKMARILNRKAMEALWYTEYQGTSAVVVNTQGPVVKDHVIVHGSSSTQFLLVGDHPDIDGWSLKGGTVPKDYQLQKQGGCNDEIGFNPLTSIFRRFLHQGGFPSAFPQISLKGLGMITALLLLPGTDAHLVHHVADTGMPVSNTVAGALAWAIGAFGDSKTVPNAVYWAVYGCWILSGLLTLAFTAWSIAQKHRLHYLGLFALVTGIIFVALVAASVDDLDKMTVRLRAWMPMAMVLVAGALPMAFPRANA